MNVAFLLHEVMTINAIRYFIQERKPSFVRAHSLQVVNGVVGYAFIEVNNHITIQGLRNLTNQKRINWERIIGVLWGSDVLNPCWKRRLRSRRNSMKRQRPVVMKFQELMDCCSRNSYCQNSHCWNLHYRSYHSQDSQHLPLSIRMMASDPRIPRPRIRGPNTIEYSASSVTTSRRAFVVTTNLEDTTIVNTRQLSRNGFASSRVTSVAIIGQFDRS